MQFGKHFAKSKICKHLKQDFSAVVLGPVTFVPDIDYESIESYRADFTAVGKKDGEAVRGEIAHSCLIGIFGLSFKTVNGKPEPAPPRLPPPAVAEAKSPNRLNL